MGSQISQKAQNIEGVGEVRCETLANGARIVSCQDNSAPIFSLQSWLDVGSRDEEKGKTGLAHLLEHLFFLESKSLRPGEYDAAMEHFGAYANASTWADWTQYQVDAPSEALGDIVDIEFARFKEVRIRKNTFEPELDVVRSERRDTVDDDVYGMSDETLWKMAFPHSFPYRHPTVGFAKEIQELKPADARTFYKSNYVASNLSVIIAGDFCQSDLDNIIALYRSLPKKGKPNRPTQFSSPAKKGKHKKMKWRTNSAKLRLAFRAPPFLHEDWLPLRLFSEAISGGPGSALQISLVEKAKVAESVAASLSPFALGGLLEFAVELREGRPAIDALSLLENELDKYRRKRISKALLQETQTRIELEHWLSMDSASGRAEQLGFFSSLTGSAFSLGEHLERMRNVSVGDVAAAVDRWLGAQGAFVLELDPR